MDILFLMSRLFGGMILYPTKLFCYCVGAIWGDKYGEECVCISCLACAVFAQVQGSEGKPSIGLKSGRGSTSSGTIGLIQCQRQIGSTCQRTAIGSWSSGRVPLPPPGGLAVCSDLSAAQVSRLLLRATVSTESHREKKRVL